MNTLAVIKSGICQPYLTKNADCLYLLHKEGHIIRSEFI